MAASALLLDPRRAPILPGSRNFRDLGGYPALDGRRVKWGRVYRSGSLAGLAPDGVDTLRRLGVTGLCDLRTTRERASNPYAWAADLGLSPWTRDYETSFGELRALMEAGFADAAEARAAMLAGYRRLPYEQAPAYRELFRRLAAGELPLVFNCSAGKDRAGTAAALVLTTLGVQRDVVLQDYALTDRFGDLDGLVAASRDNPAGLLGRQTEAVVRAIMGCDPDYIDAALDRVAPSTATFETYLSETLGIDPAARQAIQDNLLD